MRKFLSYLSLCLCLPIFAPGTVFCADAGVWKSMDESLNIYLQTYDAGSCIAIATKDGQDFLIFLDPDVSDGYAASELFGRSSDLSLNMLSSHRAEASLSTGGVSNTYSLAKVYEADCRESGAVGRVAGIWKPEDLSNNFYIQSYVDGSGIAVSTADGSAFHVFAGDGLLFAEETPEYFGGDALIRLSFDDSAAARFEREGVVHHYVLHRQSTADCRTTLPPTPPQAAFGATPLSGSAPLSVRFTNECLGDIASYHWEFGDGSTSAEPNPTHTYWGGGEYTVTLTITGQYGTDTVSRENYISTIPDYTGVWTGYYSSNILDDTFVRCEVAQEGNSITGEFSTGSGSFGLISGEIEGDRVEFVMDATEHPYCEGLYNSVGTLSPDGQSISISWSGTDCLGTHRNGTGTLSWSAP